MGSLGQHYVKGGQPVAVLPIPFTETQSCAHNSGQSAKTALWGSRTGDVQSCWLREGEKTRSWRTESIRVALKASQPALRSPRLFFITFPRAHDRRYSSAP